MIKRRNGSQAVEHMQLIKFNLGLRLSYHALLNHRERRARTQIDTYLFSHRH